MAWWWMWMACGSPEPLLDCDEPEQGDLDGYCVLGEAHGDDAARSFLEERCEGEAPLPDAVAEGPGGCDEPSDAVLSAEQAAFDACWQEAFDEVLGPYVDDGSCPVDA